MDELGIIYDKILYSISKSSGYIAGCLVVDLSV